MASMNTALRVEGISKQYRIYDRPSDRFKESLSRGRWKKHREFWALRDVSFEVERGTTTGVIGPNGCGKSTLLQIIAGTLNPTHGTVSYQGRVAALLELGAGFNPEFTGIENVFMNAALMGFDRRETEALIPEIEKFAEIGSFIRQPVKTYSSGMYVRLAFSIASSVRPEILLIDEALAVGDAVFQHRCLRRIKEMKENGTTILFVSHDPGAVRALCSQAVLLHAGRVESIGAPTEVLNRYQKIIMAREDAYEGGGGGEPEAPEILEVKEPAGGEELAGATFRHGDRSAEIVRAELLDPSYRRLDIIESMEALNLRVRIRFDMDEEAPVCGFLIRNRHGIHIYGTNTALQHVDIGPVKRGETHEVMFGFNGWLAPDTYSITVAVHSHDGISFDWIDDAIYFTVISGIAMEGVANLDAGAIAKKLSTVSVPNLVTTME